MRASHRQGPLILDITRKLAEERRVENPFFVTRFVNSTEDVTNVIRKKIVELINDNKEMASELYQPRADATSREIEDIFIANHYRVVSRFYYNMALTATRFGCYGLGYLFGASTISSIIMWFEQFIVDLDMEAGRNIVDICQEWLTPPQAAFECSKVITTKHSVYKKSIGELVEKSFKVICRKVEGAGGLIIIALRFFKNIFAKAGFSRYIFSQVSSLNELLDENPKASDAKFEESHMKLLRGYVVARQNASASKPKASRPPRPQSNTPAPTTESRAPIPEAEELPPPTPTPPTDNKPLIVTAQNDEDLDEAC